MASLCMIMHGATTLEDVIRCTKFRSSCTTFWLYEAAALEGRDSVAFMLHLCHAVPVVIPTLALAIEFAFILYICI